MGDKKRYDENGRPIKDSISFFDKVSKPKKRKYSYKVEQKEDVSRLDGEIQNSGNELQKQKVVIPNEIDLTKFPIILVYICIFVLGFFGFVLGIVLAVKSQEKEIKGAKRILKHFSIALILYILFSLSIFSLSFFK